MIRSSQALGTLLAAYATVVPVEHTQPDGYITNKLLGM